jgi:hypothetical protein
MASTKRRSAVLARSDEECAGTGSHDGAAKSNDQGKGGLTRRRIIAHASASSPTAAHPNRLACSWLILRHTLWDGFERRPTSPVDDVRNMTSFCWSCLFLSAAIDMTEDRALPS